MTRLGAALFGVMIIGCGVPVFCVIIKNALHNNEVCNHHWALFFGAFFPYLISWTLYQGTLLMSMLNWTGLVVNGCVAFLLPMVLALKTTEIRKKRARSVEMVISAEPNVVPAAVQQQLSPVNHNQHHILDENEEKSSLLHTETQTRNRSNSKTERKRRIQYFELGNDEPKGRANSNGPSSENGAVNAEEGVPNPILRSDNLEEGGYRHYLHTRFISNTTVQPLPYWLEYYRREIVIFMIFAFTTIIGLTILDDAIEGISPPPADAE
jgi:hypothetical protein